jgi:hypothetical protein
LAQRLAAEVANLALQQWKKEAQDNLHTTREDYISALGSRVASSPTEYEVFLSAKNDANHKGWLVHAVESGMKSFDMVPGYMNSGKRYLKYWSDYATCKDPRIHGPNNRKLRHHRMRELRGVDFIDVPIKLTGKKPAYFRLVHAGSRWDHPGIKARHLREKVVEHILQESEKILAKFVVKGKITVGP